MSTVVNDDLSSRVLLLAPTVRDAEVTCALLGQAGLTCFSCADLHMLSREVLRGAGAVLITEEAVYNGAILELLVAVTGQPAWSELPVVVLIRGGMQSL